MGRAVLAAALLVAGLNALSCRLRPAGWPLQLTLAPETAMETASLVSLGMRRLAADLGLVRLLIYYGTAESLGGHGEEHADGDEASHGPHPDLAWGGGAYPELGPRARRILDADPSFDYAALYASGALAFNLDRPAEALRLLDYALSRDPRNRQYLAYAAAVGVHRKGDPAGVVRLLEPVLGTPDCPIMIKHMVAYLYMKSGQRRKAAALYRVIRDTTQDPGYRGLAEAALARLERGEPR